MADKYTPGMEFQSWRSLPRITDFLSGDGVRQFLVGGAINALTGVNPTQMAQDARNKIGQPAVPTAPQAPSVGVAPVAPPAVTQPIAPVNPANPVTLPPLGQPVDNEGSIFDEINGLRR